jgi:5-(carboxyamino)imidazole ribonucleotide mutase
MSRQTRKPIVGVIMGSESDMEVMNHSREVLKEFDVRHEVRIISAHRTSARMSEYGRLAVSRGLKVIIAGAGGSAHLPGMTAAETILPVLGVAINAKNKPLQAAVASQVEMPGGVPLYYMGENDSGAKNAALGAVRILALRSPHLAETYTEYVAQMAQRVEEADNLLFEIGPEAYIKQMN